MLPVMLTLLIGASSHAFQPMGGGEAVPRKRGLVSTRNVPLAGHVTAITDESITIRGIESELRGSVGYVTERGVVTFYGAPLTLITPTQTVEGVKMACTGDGYTITDAKGNETVIRERDQTPRTFKFSPQLAAGKPQHLSACNNYRPVDVKVGDYVGTTFDRLGGEEICSEIRIFRRPGGLVPPVPNDPGDRRGNKYHERQNAENDWLDKGIPIPDRFLDASQLEARRAKIAPMPREAKPKIPYAEP